MKTEYGEGIRFCVTGGVCTLLDAGIFYLLSPVVAYQVALVCGYILSLILNYVLTIYWTFKVTPNVRNLMGVMSAHLFNLFVVRMGLMFVFITFAGLSEDVAYIPMIVISIGMNFVVIRFLVHRSAR